MVDNIIVLLLLGCIIGLGILASDITKQTSQQSTRLEYYLQNYIELQQRMDALEVRRDALEKTMVEYMKDTDKKINRIEGGE